MITPLPWYGVFTCAVCATCASAVAQAAGSTARSADLWSPPVPPRAHYTIDCRVDPAARTLKGRQVVRLTNGARHAIRRLAFAWQTSAGWSIALTINHEPVPLFAGSQDERPLLLFDLTQPLAPAADLELAFEFERPVSERDGNIQMTSWHPRLWWGFRTHEDFDVDLQVPEGYALATSGRLDPESGRYRQSGVRSFGVFLGRGLQVAEEAVGDVVVRCLFTEKGTPCARLLLRTAVDVVDYYRERFGFYPYRSLSIIPGMDRPAGGYPFATAIVAIHGQERLAEVQEIHWRWITAHEIGHQYWLEHVLSQGQNGFGWLMIGLGVLADRGYCESRGLSLEKHSGMMGRYVDGVRRNLDTTVERSEERMDAVELDFNNVVEHGKGYSIISALHCLLGPETFARIERRCLEEFAGRRLGAVDFQSICEVESGRELGWFFDPWLRSNRYLSYRVAAQDSRREGDRVVSTVKVERLGNLAMPVPVEARFVDGTAQRRFAGRLSDLTELVFDSAAPLREAVVDPDGVLPMVVPPPPMTGAELARRVARAGWTGAGRQALVLYRDAAQIDAQNPDVWKKLGMILYDGAYYEEALIAFQRTEAGADKESIWGFSAIVWQGHVLDLLGRRDEALVCYRRALERDTGGAMQHDQYGMRIHRAWVQQRLEEPFRRN